MNKHKVFISFKYTEDHYYKDKLVELSEKYGTFFDYSVGEGEISGTLSDEQIRRKIRDEFIKDATVTILLIGKNMNQSKFIDWEVHASMYDSEKNPKMGIVCINLPEIDDNECLILTVLSKIMLHAQGCKLNTRIRRAWTSTETTPKCAT
jgi:hypothetical protein